MAGKIQRGRYSVKFKVKNGATTEKFYENRSDRNREADRLKSFYGDRLQWIKVKDR